MTPVFTINFRREAFRREVARTRRRLIALGIWVAYFGAIGVVLGLYGLNCNALTNRVHLMERQVERMRTAQNLRNDWTVDAAQLAAVDHFYGSPGRWRDKLSRLSMLLPSNAMLVSVGVNEEAGSVLEIIGRIRGVPGRDQMKDVVDLVSTLHGDSVFAAGYQNIRLASSRSAEGSSPMTEFVIECR